MTEAAAPIVIGRYMLCDSIGGGGMASVYLGRAIGAGGFSRTVAIKRLHSAKAGELTSTIVDEARLASRIRHPNVVPPLDVVVSGNELLLVMEYVHGLPLSRLLVLSRNRRAPFPVPIAARIVADILAGLEAAHSAKSERGRALEIVHRDVSPQNVIIDDEGHARLVDFGIAKAEGKLVVTRAGQIKGKLAYMAPEQLGGDGIDRRVDLYATGIVFWEMLTGKRLFERSPMLVAQEHQRVLANPVPLPSSHRAVSPAVDGFVRRALEPFAERRFATAADMATALEQVTPLASAKEVSTWFSELAAEDIEKRNEVLARIEELSTIMEAPPAPRSSHPNLLEAAPASSPMPLVPTPGQPFAPQPLPAAAPTPGANEDDEAPSLIAYWRAAAMGVIAALLLTLGIVVVLRRNALHGPVPGPVVSVVPAPSPTPSVTPAVTASVVDLPPSSSVPDETDPGPPPTPPAPGTATGSGPRIKKKPPQAPQPPPPNCDPPYTIDSRGFRVPRRECLDH